MAGYTDFPEYGRECELIRLSSRDCGRTDGYGVHCETDKRCGDRSVR